MLREFIIILSFTYSYIELHCNFLALKRTVIFLVDGIFVIELMALCFL
jgi:hypothetical protein